MDMRVSVKLCDVIRAGLLFRYSHSFRGNLSMESISARSSVSHACLDITHYHMIQTGTTNLHLFSRSI